MNTIVIKNKDGRYFDYINEEELRIKLNRIVDEYNDIDTRFGEHSTTFTLPFTKNNNKLFQHAKDANIRNKFERNHFDVTVFINTEIFFYGILELNRVSQSGYECVLLSNVSDLITQLEELNLKDITTLEDIPFDYETTIYNHIMANHLSCDETHYQFPLVYYNTFFTPPDVLSTNQDVWGYQFHPDRAMQNYNYIISSTDEINGIYYHQFPLALYLVPVVEGLLKHVGWSLSGSFFEQEHIKRIIIPYVGANDIYDESTYCSDGSSVGEDGNCATGNLMLKVSNFLPDMSANEFINSLINTFNLYFTIDEQNKIISFEDYNTLFTNVSNPYVLDNKINDNTVEYIHPENGNPSIKFTKADSNEFFGNNTYITSVSNNALTNKFNKIHEEYDVYNYIGSEDGIEIDFGEPIISKKILLNKKNMDETNSLKPHVNIYIPQLTRQTTKDNQNNPFYKRDTDTKVNNTEDTIKHDGAPTLLYYYGISDSDFSQVVLAGSIYKWFYIYFHDNLKLRIPFCSPYAYTQYRERINENINGINLNSAIYASGMQSVYQMLGDDYDFEPVCSLVLSSQAEVYPTLYDTYHFEKYRRYREGYILSAEIRMNVTDWNSMKMHVPLTYKGQLYSLMSIEDFDAYNEIANIKMILI